LTINFVFHLEHLILQYKFRSHMLQWTQVQNVFMHMIFFNTMLFHEPILWRKMIDDLWGWDFKSICQGETFTIMASMESHVKFVIWLLGILMSVFKKTFGDTILTGQALVVVIIKKIYHYDGYYCDVLKYCSQSHSSYVHSKY